MRYDDELRFQRPDFVGTSKPGPEECYEIVPALIKPYPSEPYADVQRDNKGFYLRCHCCNGSGRHDSGHANVQDANDNQQCEPCKGTGEFRIQIPT